VLVSGTVFDRSALAEPFTSSRSPASEGASRGSELGALWPGLDRRGPPERLFTVQAEGGEVLSRYATSRECLFIL
jgi:hypothetical protein